VYEFNGWHIIQSVQRNALADLVGLVCMGALSDQQTHFSPHLVNYVYSIIINMYRNTQYVLPAALTNIGYIRHNTINNEN